MATPANLHHALGHDLRRSNILSALSASRIHDFAAAILIARTLGRLLALARAKCLAACSLQSATEGCSMILTLLEKARPQGRGRASPVRRVGGGRKFPSAQYQQAAVEEVPSSKRVRNTRIASGIPGTSDRMGGLG